MLYQKRGAELIDFTDCELELIMASSKGGFESTTAKLNSIMGRVKYNSFMESICAESKKQLDCLLSLWQVQETYEVLQQPAMGDDELWVRCLAS